MTDDDELLVERDGHVAVVTMNRPDRRNAIDTAQMERLESAWLELDADPDVRVIVFTATDGAFCAGADLAARVAGESATSEVTDDVDPVHIYPSPRRCGGRVGFTARHCKVYKPVITAVNGVCAGAGLHFVTDSEIVICSTDATFVDTHVNVGQVTALELGLVSEVVAPEQLLPRAMELAGLVATASPDTLRISLQAIWEGLDLGLEDALLHGYRPLVRHWKHPDAAEGARAFVEKRDPVWTVLPRAGRRQTS
jgi:enoyl-CoA hydratase/carnithine racemase